MAWVVSAVLGYLVFGLDAIAVEGHITATFDRHAELQIHRALPEAIHPLMSALSAVGGTTGIAALALLMAAYFSFRGAPWAAILTVASPVGAGMVETALKLTFHRARPHLWAVHGSPATYSFPSGHAAISLAFFAAVTLLAWRFGGSRLGVVMAALCVPLVLGIGLSRVYLGVHWPTDVLGGYAIGLAWVCTLSLILDRIMGHQAAHAADS